ncbi:N(4)-(beta-N-acetylglucosaminyl)-L-asparaginase [Bowmanella denitrificans]|uniref:N(4)-(Beta-N-acetylglucosaminyl)-L-asparaginase n=1 Tax=Bowmanella denitrificans TaxID=366582 RepID=A0ABN0WKC7_9ALTE|nr:N(4)-(beta-N-acetylglucosaminyl)-L-asparaginase [Bowmanella denitrificans]
MSSRRDFLKLSALTGALSFLLPKAARAAAKINKPIVVSTWEHGMPANQAAWDVLKTGGRALDAVEAGVRIPEADPKVRTVGLGGYPDREGKVTLDACIMDEHMNCGSVAFLQDIKHPISVARKVMENTPHVMLVGEGAKQFALQQGFIEEDLLTAESRADWQQWLQDQQVQMINIENHDTIGMLALDSDGNLSGACTTSGAAYKMHGRVGDSPLIGAGLYVDNEVGAATATGMGELMIKTVGCHLVVELMRQGASPEEACRQAVLRIAKKLGDYAQFQVGFLALNKRGEYGAYCIQSGFNYAVQQQSGAQLIDGKSLLGDKA